MDTNDMLLRAEQLIRTVAEAEWAKPQIRQTCALWLADYERAYAEPEEESSP